MVIPADWKEVRLGEHAAFFKGNGLSKSQLIDDGPQQCVHYGELFTHYGPVIETVTSKCVAFERSFKSLVGDGLMPGSDVTPRGLATASAIKVSDVVLGGDVIVIRTKPTSLYGPFLSNFIRMSKGRVSVNYRLPLRRNRVLMVGEGTSLPTWALCQKMVPS